MRVVGPLAAFLAGMVAGVGFLAAINHVVHGLWLPLALGALLSSLFVTEPWLATDLRFFGPVSVALTGSVTAGWLITGEPFRFRNALVVMFGLTAVAAFAEVGVRFRGRSPTQTRARLWTLVVVGAAILVSHASSAYAGAGRMVDWAIHHLGMARDVAEAAVHYVRKSIHFTFYGFVGLSAALASVNGRAPLPFSPSSLRFGFLATLLIAAFDETRQTTQPGRTGSVYDVILDCSGAVTFLLIFSFVAARRSRRP